MIVNNQGAGAVDASGVESNKAFNIKMGGKAFKLLSDTLYTNKPGSIVRELSCNAVDSHKAAGKSDVPFEIHLPSIYEPTFYVRDFGLGMSPEMIENTYTTYFDSTKDKDNNSIGGMGLGGKTPFAYTKSFNITSVYNGVKYFYCAMLDENDVPSISRFGDEPSTEVNGVTIEFNVEAHDYRRFANEVREQLRFFEVKPVILNNAVTGALTFETITYREDFGALRVPNQNGFGIWIVQGGVGYKVDYNQFADKIDDKDKLEFFSLYPNMVMFFDIGQIEVTISREGISYSKHTIDSIIKFVDEYAPKIFKDIKTKIEGMNTDWERLVYLNSDHTNRKFAKLAKLTLGDGGNIGDKKANIIAGSNNYMLELTKHWRGNVLGKRGFQMAFYQKGKSTRKYFNDNELLLAPTNDMVFFIRDNAKLAIARMKHYIEMNPYKQVYMIEHADGGDKVDAAFIQHMRDIFGSVEMTLVSALPEPPKNSASRRGQVVVYAHPEKSSYFKSDSVSSWGRVYDEEELESGYYMEYADYPRINENATNLTLVAKVFGAGLFDKQIFVIKDKKASILKDNPNFTSAVAKAEEIIKEKKEELLKSKLMIDRYNLAQMLKAEVHSILSGNNMLNHLLSVSKEFGKGSMVNRLARGQKVAQRYAARVDRVMKTEKSEIIRELMAAQTMDDQTRKANIKVVKKVADLDVVKQFYNKYPMLRELERNSYGWMDAKEQQVRNNRVIEYIKMVDKIRQSV